MPSPGTFCPSCGVNVSTEMATAGEGRVWRCVTCGYCVEVCPKKSLAMTTGHGHPSVTRDREFY